MQGRFQIEWPVGGDNFKEGTYEIESERRGYALELVVDFTRMAGGCVFCS